MDPGTIISLIEYTGDVIIYVKGVFGAPQGRKQLTLVLVQLRGILSALVDLVQEVEDADWSRTLQTLMGDNGPIATYKTILEEITNSICGGNTDSKTAKLKAAAKRLKWPYDEPKLQEKINSLERLKSHFLIAINNDHLRLSMAIQSDLHSVKAQVTAVRTDMYRLAITNLKPEQEAVVQSLSMLDMSSKLDATEMRSIKAGAERLLQNPTFCAWRDLVDGQFSLLLTGRAGTGKTSIAKVVDYFLKAWFVSEPDVCSVSVLFDFRLADSQGEAAVLSSIVQQMVLQHPYLWRHCSARFVTGGILSVEDSLEIIKRVRLDLRRLYLILDGLDESLTTTMEQVMQRVSSIEPPISLFATSRPCMEIFHVMAQSSRISIDSLDMRDPVADYVRSWISEHVKDGRLIKLSVGDVDEIITKIVPRSNGVFTYCKLALDRLLDAKSVAQMRNLLDNQPSCLADFYELSYEKVKNQPSKDEEQAQYVLKLVLEAEQPPSIEELYNRLQTDLRLQKDELLDLGNPSILEMSTGGLLVKQDDQAVSFVHFTAREFCRFRLDL
ncbi:hypothetical protein K431DRAFT_238224 [Polychaeton citri CBS 116435]|uniref:Nephrocystin 3-like N-terminal domain-containing protein n=1 Tax=Polychaeton citri CBS 116435 TaxID=1314669 RepID=A0A9P4QJJ9_9PEZI|nr:hypothetical protein K431DRAFT_238224 [Polychaeton citri CBS 116435]